MSRFGATPIEGHRFGAEPIEPPMTISNMQKMAIEGLTGQQVDMETGLDFWSRADLSLSDTDEEKAAKFMKKYPQGSLRRINIPEMKGSYLLFKQDVQNPDEQWKTVEEESFTVKDLADIAGQLPEFVGSTLPFAHPSVRAAGVTKQAIVSGLGATFGHLGKEAVEEARGTQLQPRSEVLYDAGGRGLMTAGATALGGGLQKAYRGVTGGGYIDLPERSQQLLETVSKRPELAEYAPIGVVSPEHKIIQRLTAQAVSTARKGQQFIQEAEEAAVKEMQKLAGPEDFDVIGTGLKQEIKKTLGAGRAAILGKTQRVSLEKGGKAAQQGLKDDFVRASSAVARKLYNQVDEAATRENPQFDLTKAIAEADILKKGLMAEGIEEAVDVADIPQRQLLSVVGKLSKLNPTQTDYNVIKSLRTELWDLIDNQPWQWDTNKYKALQMYNKLSDTLKNPITNAPGYQSSIKTASAYWSQRSNILKDPHIQSLISSGKPVDVAKTLSAEGGFTENVNNALKQVPARRAKEIKNSVKYHWLVDEPGKAVEKINRMRQIDPEGFKRVVGKDEVHSLLAIGKQLDELNSSRMAQVFQKQSGAGRIVKDLVDNQDIDGVRQLVSQFGGKDSKRASLLKAGILEDMLNQTTELTKENTLKINPGKFAKLWRDYNRNGIMDLLMTSSDKEGVAAINAYSKMWERSIDPGVSLEAAQLITLMKHPDTFLKGVHGLTVNEVLARVLLSPKTRNFFIGKGKQQIAGTWPKVLAIGLEDIVSSMDASAEEPLMTKEGMGR